MKRLLVLLFIAVILSSCAKTTRVPISKVVGSDTVRTKIVLLPNSGFDISYQKLAVREYENALTRQPFSRAVRSVFGGGSPNLVLVVRKEVQEVSSLTPETIKRIGEESGVNTVIVLEPKKIEFKQGSVKRDDEFCVSRSAEVEISIKMGETKGGEIVFAGVYQGKAKARQCSKGMRRTDKLPSEERLIIRAIKKSAVKFSEELWSSL